MSSLLPRDVLERVIKADFTKVVVDQIQQKTPFLEASGATLRPEWLEPTGLKRLQKLWQENPSAGWPIWVLSGLLGCDAALPKQGAQTRR